MSLLSRADVVLGRARPDRLVATEATLDLRRRLGLAAIAEPLVARPGRPFALGRARLELLPSGILPGAAQLLIDLDGPSGKWKGLYAGTVSLRPICGAEPLQVRACDEMVVDAPETGGVVDDAIVEAALAAALLVPADGLALLGLLDFLADVAVSLPARWSSFRPAHRRGSALTIGVRLAGRRGRMVVAGRREPSQDALALGLLPTVEQVERFILDSGPRRVHVRVLGRGPLELAGARELLQRLRRRRLDARVIAPPEQLTLFPA